MSTGFILEGISYQIRDLKRLRSETSSDDRHRIDFFEFLSRWFDRKSFIEVKTSGSTGTPKLIRAQKEAMRKSAYASIKFFNLKYNQSVLIALPLNYIAGMMMIVRALEAAMNIFLATPSSTPLLGIDQRFNFAPFTPMQLSSMLERGMKDNLEKIETILLGGSPIFDSLEQKLQTLKSNVFSSYGMTETLAHVALRRINGDLRESVYRPLPGVKISYSKNKTLVLETPWTERPLITTDLVDIKDDGTFTIIGREDQTINSGGIKLHPEELESVFAPFIEGCFAMSSLQDNILGEALVLVTEREINFEGILEQAREKLTKYQLPKRHFVLEIPKTDTGKIARKELKEKVDKFYNNRF